MADASAQLIKSENECPLVCDTCESCNKGDPKGQNSQDKQALCVAEFTDEQQSFLRHEPHKPGRLIAGPGAGKSFTCVAYMEMYSKPKEGFPARIRMLTFTRAAAAEFAETMQKQGLGEGIQPPSTIHAFALSVLRKSAWASIPQPVRIADSWETEHLIRPQLSRLLKAQGHETATPSQVRKLEQEMAAGFEALDPAKVLIADLQPELRNAYQGLWGKHRFVLGYVLLGELPYRAGLAIEDLGVPNLDLDLLLVDEYQDLNRADIRLIRLVADSGLAVLAIGDEDQSIYGYRHAAPEGIREFPADFKIDKGDDYRFTISRRCGADILSAAQALIEQAPGRPKQAPMTPLDASKPGIIEYLRFGNMAAEADGVARIIAARLAAGVPAKQIAVLARSRVDAWVTALKPALDARGINIASSAWVDVALDDLELRRLRALAYLSINAEDSLAWLTLLTLRAGIGSTVLDRLFEATASGEDFSNTLRRICADGLETLSTAQLSKVREIVAEADNELNNFEIPGGTKIAHFGDWLEERANQPLSAEAKKLLKIVGDNVDNVSLAEFLANLEPMGSDFALNEQDAIRFMTMGASKGLTVDTAIVVGVEEGIIPLPAPRGDADEERRLLYVAMTRATDYCLLTYSTRRVGPLARVGSENLGSRTRSPLLIGVRAPVDASEWINSRGW